MFALGRLFVTCAHGAENHLLRELAALGLAKVTPGNRGAFVYVENGLLLRTAYKINYCSRVALRVLLPIAQFPCNSRDELYQGVRTVQNWSDYFVTPKGMKTFAIDAVTINSKTFVNSMFAAQVTKDAIVDTLRTKTGSRPSIDTANPQLRFHLHVDATSGIGTLSFDTSAVPLYLRGYKTNAVSAPVQETLAASILLSCFQRYLKDRQSSHVLYDPCCGSGTLLIEAALLATNTHPGVLRTEYGFMHHPEYRLDDWLAVKHKADAASVRLSDSALKHILGTDIDKAAVGACRANLRNFARRSDVVGARDIATLADSPDTIVHSDFRVFSPKYQPTVVVTNPPYGARLLAPNSTDEISQVYRDLGEWAKKHMQSGSLVVLTGNPRLSNQIGLPIKWQKSVWNGGLKAQLVEYELNK